MEKSRTANAVKNMRTGMIVQIVNKLMIFIVRTVFIKVLNTEYLGLNGLFSNILTILSFAELGIGTAIIFNMYKPVAENDKEKIKSLMKLYKKTYSVVGTLILILGLCIIPFMNIVIKETPQIEENIIYIYILFLINTSISYFFTYKKSIISAHQQENIINRYDSIIYLLKSIIEIIFLLLTKNYIIYLWIEIIMTICENITISIKADRMFPYLKEKNVAKVSKNETREIFNNVKALVVYKIGTTIMNGTDNIIISALIDIRTVGMCSNYTMIINSIQSIIQSALNGLTASVGNLNVQENTEQKEKVFYQLVFITSWIYTFCAIALIVLLNPFINIWLGNEHILPLGVSVALSTSFFINGTRFPTYTYRVTMGLFRKGKITPYIAIIVNIIFSIILCKIIGVTGVFIATAISQICSYVWIDPYLIHKYEFKTPVKKYFKKYSIYLFVFMISAILCYMVTSLIQGSGILSFILKTTLVILIPNLIMILSFHNSEEYIETKKRMIEILKRKCKRSMI